MKIIRIIQYKYENDYDHKNVQNYGHNFLIVFLNKCDGNIIKIIYTN